MHQKKNVIFLVFHWNVKGKLCLSIFCISFIQSWTILHFVLYINIYEIMFIEYKMASIVLHYYIWFTKIHTYSHARSCNHNAFLGKWLLLQTNIYRLWKENDFTKQCMIDIRRDIDKIELSFRPRILCYKEY